MANPNLQMHEPFRIPKGWDGQERRLVAQLEEVFDDLYRRFGRLRIEDMGSEFKLTWFDMGNNIANFNGELYGDEETGKIGLTTRMEDAEGNVTNLWTRAGVLAAEISDAQGNINQLTATAQGLQAHMEDAENNINDLQITAQGYGVRLGNAEGNITQLALRADGLALRIEDTEGNVNELQETAQSVTRRLSDAEGNITSLTITAQGLDSRVQNAQGDISVLQQTATDITAAVEDAEDNIGALQVTANRITEAVFDADGNYSGVNITSTGITIDASKTLEIKSGSKLKLASGGTLDITSTNFKVDGTTGAVTVTGVLTTNAGSYIGGWYIGSNYIGNDDALNDSTIGFASTGSGKVLWAGGARNGTGSSAPKFYVTAAGTLNATGAAIGGTLTANDDSSIGGWKIRNAWLYKNTGSNCVCLGGSTTDYVWPVTLNDSKYAFWAGADWPENTPSQSQTGHAPVRITKAGSVLCRWLGYIDFSTATPTVHYIDLESLVRDYGSSSTSSLNGGSVI